MRALVTGAGGFLGRYLCEQLVARGDQVRGFSRSHYPELAALGVEQVQGDIRDEAAVVDGLPRHRGRLPHGRAGRHLGAVREVLRRSTRSARGTCSPAAASMACRGSSSPAAPASSSQRATSAMWMRACLIPSVSRLLPADEGDRGAGSARGQWPRRPLHLRPPPAPDLGPARPASHPAAPGPALAKGSYGGWATGRTSST